MKKLISMVAASLLVSSVAIADSNQSYGNGSMPMAGSSPMMGGGEKAGGFLEGMRNQVHQMMSLFDREEQVAPEQFQKEMYQHMQQLQNGLHMMNNVQGGTAWPNRGFMNRGMMGNNYGPASGMGSYGMMGNGYGPASGMGSYGMMGNGYGPASGMGNYGMMGQLQGNCMNQSLGMMQAMMSQMMQLMQQMNAMQPSSIGNINEKSEKE